MENMTRIDGVRDLTFERAVSVGMTVIEGVGRLPRKLSRQVSYDSSRASISCDHIIQLDNRYRLTALSSNPSTHSTTSSYPSTKLSSSLLFRFLFSPPPSFSLSTASSNPSRRPQILPEASSSRVASLGSTDR
jgi:hypothetical protein